MNGRRLEMRQSFDLEKGPLFKFRLARLESQYHLLIFTYHHSIVDGQSVGVFFKELKAYYSAECRGEVCSLPEPRQFSDYLQDPGRQRSEVTNDAHEAYWMKAFAGGVTLLNLPWTTRDLPFIRSGENVTPGISDRRSHTSFSSGAAQGVALLF